MTPVNSETDQQFERESHGKRADAERNRQRILAAARELYEKEGLEASMAAIARKAGVGKATLSRHFTTPTALIESVFTEHMAAYVEATEMALTQEDSWQGFVDYIMQVCRMQAEDRGFADVLTLAFMNAGELQRLRLRAYQGFLTLIERARGTGHLRDDFASEDLILVLIANAAVIAAIGTAVPNSWQRLTGHLLRGFAVPGAPLPPIPPAPSSEALYGAMNQKL